MLNINTQAPSFSGLNQDNKTVSLSDYLGKWVVLYFYPKDDTSGCTKEACGIRDNYSELQKYAEVIGVSSDSVESHKQFADKYHLPFTLIADPDRKIIKSYDANGILAKRISYLINPKGIISKAYPNVNPSQHAEEIIADLKELSHEN
jgi:peroxiredoxin Q/BCP